MTIYRVEVEKRLQVTFYVDAESEDQAGDIGGEVAEGIDDIDWDDWSSWDIDAKEVVADASIEGPGTRMVRRALHMNPAHLAEQVKDKGAWVGGPKGTWEYDLEWQTPPPAPDPNQGSLL